MAEVSRNMEGNAKLRRFPQGRMVDQVVLVGGATRMPCVQASQAKNQKKCPLCRGGGRKTKKMTPRKTFQDLHREGVL